MPLPKTSTDKISILRRITYFLATFILTSGALLVFFHHLSLFNVTDIPVEIVNGASNSSESARANTASFAGSGLKDRVANSLQKFKGQNIWNVDLAALKAAVVGDEWVKDVLISRSFPNEIRVSIRQKNPVLLLIGQQGDFFPVTDNGRLLHALPSGALPDVPILRGETFSNSDGASADRRANAVKFILGVSDKGILSRRNISEMTWTTEDGYTLTLIQPKIEVKLGDDDIDMKAMRVAQVLSYLSINHLKGRVIDASFSKKVLVRLRKGS
jgi:cell division protein FtsQ